MEFKETVDRLWSFDGTTASARSHTNHERRLGQLMELFRHADTQTDIRGTRWAGLQAITEYLDHYAPAKNADARANRVLTSVALADKKQQAHQLLAV